MLSLFILCLLGYILTTFLLSHWPIETIPFFVISSIIVLLYFAGLYDALQLTTYSILALGFIFFVISASSILLFRRSLLSQLITPGSLYFIAGLVFLLLYFQNATYYFWDEFSHWGLSSKEIFLTNGLLTHNSVTPFKDYPPGATLFHYPALLLNGSFSEQITYFTQSLLLLAPLTLLLQTFDKVHWRTVIFVILFIYIAIFTLGEGIRSLYIDSILGVFFGCALASYFINKGALSSIIRLLPVVFCLVLFKSTGLLFAWLIVATIGIDQATKFILNRKNPTERKTCTKECVRAFGYILLLIVAIFIAKTTWHDYFINLGSELTFKTNFTYEQIKTSFSADATAQEKTIINNFIKAVLWDQRISHSVIPLFFWFIILLGLSWFSYKHQIDNSKKRVIITLSSTLFLGGIIYVVGLLLLYLYAYPPYEASILASFSRYMAIYILAWTCVVTAFIVHIPSSEYKTSNYQNYLFLGLLILILLAARPNRPFKFPSSWSNQKPQILEIKQLADTIKLSIPDYRNQQFAFIWENSQGFENKIFTYQMSPGRTSGCWSISKPYKAEDIWSCNLTPESWTQQLIGVNYLVLGKTTPVFWQQFGALFVTFSIDNSQHHWLFKIEPSTGEIIEQIELQFN